MAQLDFPASPAVNDRYPTPAVAGKPQYSWDGEKWTTASGSTTTAPPASATPLEDNATPQVGVTTKYAREDHVHPSTALKYSTQTLTSAQQEQSRKNVYAAPLDALAYSGMQINGSMEVSQELGLAAAVFTGTHKYIIDHWQGWSFGVQGMQGFLNSTVPPGYLYSLQLAVSTANPSPAPTDNVALSHYLEGYRVIRLAWGTASARPLTIAFWINLTRPGTYSLAVRNGAANRSYATTFTVSAAMTWEYKIVTIPGDVTGAWAKDNTIGLSLWFGFMAGSSAGQPPNVWTAGGAVLATGITNLVVTTSDWVLLTGLIVLPGIEAPSSDRSPLIMRPYDQELLTCQRYYEETYSSARFHATIAGLVLDVPVYWKAVKRAAPTTAVKTAGTRVNLAGVTVINPTAMGAAHQAQANATGDVQSLSELLYADARL